MVSTLSGLNFNLYRERLGKTKVQFHQPPDIPPQSMPYLFLFYRSMAAHTFIHTSSILSHWPLSFVTSGQALLTQAFTTAVTCVHAHMLQARWKGKLRLSVPHAPEWTPTLRQDISCSWFLSAWFPTKATCQQHFWFCSGWRLSTKCYWPSSEYQQC